ncbi:hypothetical protein LN475_10700 [Xanthomonas vesicatoria]|uniref:hypothetical protein n=1 Tax=Xanthomonas vesicatoria TaxID=56460 RepID=UPI000F8EE6E3|nr:hypothetical protein [Xanthomonas vesicatoria]MCC8597126.1 hypothetical protein [Xanthomonas vesicatoria]MCC8605503.1 hypothetical protein [Xanthomonas vesicatoria]
MLDAFYKKPQLNGKRITHQKKGVPTLPTSNDSYWKQTLLFLWHLVAFWQPGSQTPRRGLSIYARQHGTRVALPMKQAHQPALHGKMDHGAPVIG